jgi:pimeloyl-ACP methyl ester carboxylesterase
MLFSFVQSSLWIQWTSGACLVAALLGGNGTAFGQAKATPGKEAKKAAAEIPEPENITVETKDDVRITATYYASGPVLKDKKKAIPIIMLHGWEGNRGEWHALASYLQSQGYAVICPDLRGHGQSLKYKLPGGDTKEFDLERMKGAEIEKMVLDVEAIKQFLLQKNNAGELNIEALCVIGAHVGCTIAMNWSAADWNVRSLPSFKQGQDVKAMVLLSPVDSFRGVTTRGPLTHPIVRGKLSTLICVGKEDAKAYADSKRLYTSLLKFHGKPPAEEKEALKRQDLFFVEQETSLQGTDLLGKGLQTPSEIQKFLYLRLSLKLEEYAWTERKNPLQSE